MALQAWLMGKSASVIEFIALGYASWSFENHHEEQCKICIEGIAWHEPYY
jgi:hypothetical protein